MNQKRNKLPGFVYVIGGIMLIAIVSANQAPMSQTSAKTEEAWLSTECQKQIKEYRASEECLAEGQRWSEDISRKFKDPAWRKDFEETYGKYLSRSDLEKLYSKFGATK